MLTIHLYSLTAPCTRLSLCPAANLEVHCSPFFFSRPYFKCDNASCVSADNELEVGGRHVTPSQQPFIRGVFIFADKEDMFQNVLSQVAEQFSR